MWRRWQEYYEGLMEEETERMRDTKLNERIMMKVDGVL